MFFKDEQIKNRVEQTSRNIVFSVGENVKYLRKKRKLSRTKFLNDLFKSYGIKMSYNGLVQLEWSNKKVNVELKTIVVLSMFFNVSMDSLMFLNYPLHEN